MLHPPGMALLCASLVCQLTVHKRNEMKMPTDLLAIEIGGVTVSVDVDSLVLLENAAFLALVENEIRGRNSCL